MTGDDSSERELNLQLQVLLAPYGSPGNQRDRERALAYLLAHADVAHDLLVDVVRALAPGTHTIAAIAALPAFGREESVGPLETALRHGTEAVRLAAAEGLARHPSARARHVLARAAGDADPAIRDLARSVLTDLESKPGDQS